MRQVRSEKDLTLTVAELAARLGIGKNQAYEAVRRNEIPSLQVGRSRSVAPGRSPGPYSLCRAPALA